MIYSASFDSGSTRYIVEHMQDETIVYQTYRYSDHVEKYVFKSIDQNLFDKLLYSNENSRNMERLHNEIKVVIESKKTAEFWEMQNIETMIKTMLAVEQLIFNQFTGE